MRIDKGHRVLRFSDIDPHYVSDEFIVGNDIDVSVSYVGESNCSRGICIDHVVMPLLAASEQLRAALVETTAELQRLHRHSYPDCDNGCPTMHIVMQGVRALVAAQPT